MPKAERRRHKREQQAFREQLPDDAPPRGAKRQSDANLALASDAAREQQVRDVRATDQQDQPESEEERREHDQGLGRQRDRALLWFEDEVCRLAVRPSLLCAAARPTREAPQAPVRATRRASAARRCRRRRSLPGLHAFAGTGRRRERRPEVRRGDREPAKAFRHHPDDLERHVVHHDRAIDAPGSVAKCRAQPRWLRTSAGRPPSRRRPVSASARRAAVTPSTWKKFPVTSEPASSGRRCGCRCPRSRMHRRTRRSRGGALHTGGA